jgi:Family of unknown function (DUF6368)
MAGPTNHLITRKLSIADIATLTAYLQTVARINDGRENYGRCSHWWDIQLTDGVVSRPRLQKKLRPEQWYPLIVTVEELTEESIAEYRSNIPDLELELGSQIALALMVNDLSGKRSMVQLGINLLKMFGGYIDLLGLLYPPVNENYGQLDIDREAEITSYTANVPGRIYQRYHEIESHGTKHFSQIVDREFLENWLADDRFNIAK